ncbi:LysR family transcriptional regulator [Sphaerotilus natans subsp. natans DSM 6575]|jgi:DNA-binding transcriptional LysR family regulator|uniref:LysR family transcriptional regulator n=1 Tax=Sphaerotilus natans subsp. natans DSM 6575 TaxID=1286631 RepID=A0A059KGK9_9BURK|nr:LysR family transcriptional regulator [Sphaerotilus natans]KDB50566.1 LysR family transcriptional regulator [Sphaerotilus natans subsp. natans DSM 6575]SIR48876.1 DNA-binding transcriptional regulator, LysR family [Sphaerotilus natans]
MTSPAFSPDDLRVFLRVAALASFSEAARQLDLPRATVSSAVQRLEAHLGTRLLHRTTRRVQLTPDGQAFAERGQDVLADLDELRTLFQHDPAQLTGRLRVDMPLGVARGQVLPRLPEFLARHPALKIDVCSTDRRVDLVREGFDCVLRVGPVVAEGLVARPLGALAMANIASPAYLARHGVPTGLADLERHRLVHYQPNPGVRPAGFEFVDPEGPPGDDRTRSIAMPGAVTVNNSEGYMAACEAGLGIVQIPRARARERIAAGTVVEILPDHRPAPMPVTLLYAHRRHQPRRVRSFMDWLAGLFGPDAAS